MAELDPAEQIKELTSTLENIEAVLDLDAKRTEIEQLREQSADPELWNDQANAQKVTRRLSFLESEVSKVENIRSRIDDLGVLFELAAAENDAETLAEARRELAALRKDISDLEVRTLLSGPYDEREALISINAQAGGVDAADWDADAAADVPPLGGAPRLPDGDLRDLLR